MNTELFKLELTSFRDSISGVIRENPDAGIVICVGTASETALNEHLKSVPANSIFVYIFRVLPDTDMNFHIKISSANNRIITIPMRDDSFYSEKTGVLISLSGKKTPRLNIESQFESEIPERLAPLKEAIRTAVSNIAQSDAAALAYLQNSIKNLPFLLRDWHNKVTVSGTDTAVVCAAGPSLENDLPLLKQYAGKILIIAVGRAAANLLNNGIKPDFTVDVDPNVLWERENNGAEFISVLSASARPDKQMETSKNLWVYGDSHGFNRILKECGAEFTDAALSVTVTVTALDMAKKLACKNIALTGSDLCFSKSGSCYANDNTSIFNEQSELLQVEGNNGNTVLSDKGFISLNDAINTYIESANIKIFNCSKGGAKIPAAEYRDLSSFLMDFSRDDKKSVSFESNGAVPESAARLLTVLSNLFKRYISIIKNLHECARKLERELCNSDSKITKLQILHAEMKLSLEELSKLAETKPLAYIIPDIERTCECFMNDCILKPDNSLPVQNIRFLKKRYEILGNIISDISCYLSEASALINSELSPLPEYYDRKFDFFRLSGIDFIRHRNPEFADFIRDRNNFGCKKQFQIIPHLQTTPIIDFISNTGKLLPLHSRSIMHMEINAEKQIIDFLEQNKFSPESDMLLIICPANWVHVKKFHKQFPSAEAAVIELWPELLSTVIDINLFSYHEDNKILVSCIHKDLPVSEKLLKNFISAARNKNKRILVFRNPYAMVIPEIAEKISSIENLLMPQ